MKVEGGFDYYSKNTKKGNKNDLLLFANPSIRHITKDNKKTNQPLCILSYNVDTDTLVSQFIKLLILKCLFKRRREPIVN